MPKTKIKKASPESASVQSNDKIKRVLALQTAISAQAVEEIKTISNTSDPKTFLKSASKLLERYARYATLTEFKLTKNLANATKWGATFGLTTLVGAFILTPAQNMLKSKEDLRDVFIKFLIDMNSKKQQIKMDSVYSIFAVLAEAHGILWSKENTLALTVTGHRVLLHLLDAVIFIEKERWLCL